nr:NADH oxidase [Kibdelosporangium sp. MJ126-NF4]CTQ90701.1 NADH oxidase [Kibdelosporangium sp. MJ126-NF4]
MNHQTIRVRVSSCGVSFWDAGKLVWDDTLGHRQFALVDGAETLLRWFSEWKPLESTGTMTDDPALRERYAKIAKIFLDHNVLVAEGSPRHRFEESATSAFQPWGRLASAFHFATRNLADEAAMSPEDYDAMLVENLKLGPPPRAHHTFADAPVVQLPDWSEADWQERDLLDLLYRRRSDRKFIDKPIPLESAAALLKVSAGIVEIDEQSQTAFKTSPSGGGRHPTEVYVLVRAVDGIEPGVYHYNPTAHTLARIGGPCSDEDLSRIVGEQAWTENSAMMVFYTAVLERSMWKYRTARIYRVLHFDVGHLNQTVYLLVTALGLGMTFTSAVRDELVEQLLGIDPAGELVMGCAVIGSKA